MEIIFIDTSIFEANNFLESKKIKELFRLAKEKHLRIIIPQLIYDEILNRVTKNIESATNKFKKYRDETRILRNVPSLSSKFEPFDKEIIANELYDIIESVFKDSKIEIIEYPTLNIKGIFKSYFEKKFPFGSGAKKSEFPDAFALRTVELWAEKENLKVIAFSNDKDMLNYNSNFLEINKDFDKFLSNKIKEVEAEKLHKIRLDKINNIIFNESQELIREITEWAEYQLDDNSIYYEYSNYHDVHDVSIDEVNVDIEDYNITNVKDEFISVQLKVFLNYKVEIIIDDENYMFKDYETKEWFFYETKPLFINEIRYIKVDIVFEIDSDDIVFEPEIESINNDKKLNV